MVITDMAPALSLPPWRPLLSAARRREGRAPGDRWLQLATLALDGSPRVRTLVFRDWSGESEMDLLTDARSEKCLEIVRTPMVEVCWLFRKARVQFRLRGTAKLMSPSKDPVVLSHLWNRLTPSGRSVWAWPHPGMPFQEEGPWVQELPDGTDVPKHVRLVRVRVDRVEQLDLKHHPHLRRLWTSDMNWQEQRLNP